MTLLPPNPFGDLLPPQDTREVSTNHPHIVGNTTVQIEYADDDFPRIPRHAIVVEHNNFAGRIYLLYGGSIVAVAQPDKRRL
jgi:hypothetical protein